MLHRADLLSLLQSLFLFQFGLLSHHVHCNQWQTSMKHAINRTRKQTSDTYPSPPPRRRRMPCLLQRPLRNCHLLERRSLHYAPSDLCVNTTADIRSQHRMLRDIN